MLIEAAAVITALGQIYKSIKIDEATLSTLKEAYDTHAEAMESLKRHKQAVDTKLQKLVNRKRALLSGRLPQFIDVYQQIQRINFQPGAGILELENTAFTVRDTEEVTLMIDTARKPMTDKELVIKYLMRGAGGMLIADSKRNAQIADDQLYIASTIKAQTENMEIVLDAIGTRADQIANVLARFGILLGKSITETERIIGQNGLDRNRYSQSDRETLMTCVNLAKGIKDILDVPILGQDGSVTAESLKALECSQKQLFEFEKKIRSIR